MTLEKFGALIVSNADVFPGFPDVFLRYIFGGTP